MRETLYTALDYCYDILNFAITFALSFATHPLFYLKILALVAFFCAFVGLAIYFLLS